jgi:hypothetical protein
MNNGEVGEVGEEVVEGVGLERGARSPLGLVGGLEIVPLGRGSGDVILGLEKTTF